MNNSLALKESVNESRLLGLPSALVRFLIAFFSAENQSKIGLHSGSIFSTTPEAADKRLEAIDVTLGVPRAQVDCTELI